ncbi:MAG: DNA damage-inducible protein D [Ruminiclostridium sp.]|nr:DNA damage-inducible protein D [Ruminiclostridium sp.]
MVELSIFERIKRVNEYGSEYWLARELQGALDYKHWRSFVNAIDKAKIACENSGNAVSDHFADVRKIVEAGVTSKDIGDIKLSRYACYLIVQNGDPRKKSIALGQTYFAIQTRRQEIAYGNLLDEDQRRLKIRADVKHWNRELADRALEAGIQTELEYATFQNAGYMGLYGGLTVEDIHKRKKLSKNEKILDNMGSVELAANLFRITQTEDKLRREQIFDKKVATKTHHAVGKKVRQTIKELGGEMPENLPKPELDIKKLENKIKKEIKKSKKPPMLDE